MKYHFEIMLNAPRSDVWAAFSRLENLKKWQPTLTSIEHLSGTPGEHGAKSRLTYEENGHKIEMTETVEYCAHGSELTGRYDTSHGTNLLSNRFEEVGGGQTRWIVDAEFLFKGFLMSIVGFFLRGVIKKRVEADCNRFKAKLEAGEMELSS